jgi:hypothetical protein
LIDLLVRVPGGKANQMKTTILVSVAGIVLTLPAIAAAANSIVPVPEPASGLLLLLAGGGVAAYRRLRTPRQ